MSICVSVCVSILYRNPHGWTDRDEIWHGGGPRGGEGSWGGFNPVPPPPPGYGVCKGGMGCLWSLNRAFWRKLYKTKVAGRVTFSGPKSGSGRTWAQCDSLSRRVYKIKVVMHNHRDRPMSGYPIMLDFSIISYISILFLIPILNHPGQRRVTQASLLHKGQCLSVCLCVCVCVFSIEIQTAGWIGMKFGTEVVLKGGKALGGVSARYPTPWIRGA